MHPLRVEAIRARIVAGRAGPSRCDLMRRDGSWLRKQREHGPSIRPFVGGRKWTSAGADIGARHARKSWLVACGRDTRRGRCRPTALSGRSATARRSAMRPIKRLPLHKGCYRAGRAEGSTHSVEAKDVTRRRLNRGHAPQILRGSRHIFGERSTSGHRKGPLLRAFLMPPPGIEPGTFGLRVRCSAS